VALFFQQGCGQHAEAVSTPFLYASAIFTPYQYRHAPPSADCYVMAGRPKEAFVSVVLDTPCRGMIVDVFRLATMF
jgi:hypothetical protein